MFASLSAGDLWNAFMGLQPLDPIFGTGERDGHTANLLPVNFTLLPDTKAPAGAMGCLGVPGSFPGIKTNSDIPGTPVLDPCVLHCAHKEVSECAALYRCHSHYSALNLPSFHDF